MIPLTFDNNHDFITLFENKLSEYTGAPFVVLTDSCTHAIDLSLKYFLKNYYLPSGYEFLNIPKQTYISVPQTIKHNKFIVSYEDIKWYKYYKIGDLPIFDYAVGFEPNIYKAGEFQCLSFQQKKALNIGKGGAILLDDKDAYTYLKRLTWDGRNASIPVKEDKNILEGYHYYMSPEDAAKGILLLNQLDKKWIDYKLGSYLDYPDISKIISE